MKGEGVGRTSMHDDRVHPYPALRSGGRHCTGDPVQARGVAWAVVHDRIRATHRVAPTIRPRWGGIGCS
jgi:hypothetical protein